jgi:hypothetical protein
VRRLALLEGLPPDTDPDDVVLVAEAREGRRRQDKQELAVLLYNLEATHWKGAPFMDVAGFLFTDEEREQSRRDKEEAEQRAARLQQIEKLRRLFPNA